MKYQRPTVYLKRAGVPFSRRHHAPVETAQALAQVLGVSGYQVAKTVMVEADGGIWMAVVPAPEVVDLQRLASVLGAPSIRLLDEAEFADRFPGCEIGTQPPLGKLYSVPVVVDGDLAEEPEISFLAGSHDEAITMRFRDFSRLEAPLIADFSVLPGWPQAEGSEVTVADLMTRNVLACHTEDHLNVPARLMWEADCGAVPVLDPATERVVAMITDRDICMATFFQDRAPGAVPVKDAMSSALYVCSKRDSLADAERVLRDNQVRRLPVVDEEGRLEGILSLADVIRRAERENGRPRAEIAFAEVTTLLGEICQPRSPARPEPLRLV
jgi:Ala-tRNA(Pro) deacylase